MLALQGYYDGNAVQTLEKIQAKKNQKLCNEKCRKYTREIRHYLIK